MHQHNQDIIMALAEEDLGPEAAASALAEVAECPECSRDLDMQLTARRALLAMAPPALTDFESARIRRGVREELGIAKEAKFEPSRRRRMPLAALGTAAAVLLAVVVAGPALNLIGGDSAASSDETVTVAEASPATSTAFIDRSPSAGIQGAGDMQENVESPTSTRAAIPTTPDEEALYAYFAASPDIGELRATAAGAGYEEDLTKSLVMRLAGDSIVEYEPETADACINVTKTIENDFVGGYQIARGEIEGRQVLYIVYLAEDLQESVLVVQAADNCEELYRAGP